MTQDKFVRLMVESGLARYVQVEKTCVSNALQHFTDLVLEEAAKVCEEYDMDHVVGQQLATAIRQMKHNVVNIDK